MTTNADYIRQQLNFSDDEWVVIQPKLQKVLDLQAAYNGTTARGRGGMTAGGAGGAFGQGPGFTGTTATASAPAAAPVAAAAATASSASEAVTAARAELQTLLQLDNPAPDQVKVKLKALRDARIVAKEALTKAQADLAKILTIRQEAMLVNLQILE